MRIHSKPRGVIVLLAVLATACTSVETGPTVPTPPPTPETVVSDGERAADPALAADVPSGSAWTFDGPAAVPPACLTPSDVTRDWTWTVTHAPERLRILAHAFHDPEAGCAATTKGVASLLTVRGPDEYQRGQSGTTRLVYDREKLCGRVQVDADVVTDTGTKRLVLGQVIDYGVNCAPPPPPPPPPTPPPPPPTPPVPQVSCEAPTYRGPNPFTLTGSELAYVRTHVSARLEGPGNKQASGTSWTSPSPYAVVLIKAAGLYTLHLKVAAGAVLTSATPIERVAIFECGRA